VFLCLFVCLCLLVLFSVRKAKKDRMYRLFLSLYTKLNSRLAGFGDNAAVAFAAAAAKAGFTAEVRNDCNDTSGGHKSKNYPKQAVITQHEFVLDVSEGGVKSAH
jgi:hypothetical protein